MKEKLVNKFPFKISPAFVEILGKILPIFLLTIAGFALYELLREYTYSEILNQVKKIENKKLVLAIFLCCLNYFILTLYDTLAFQYLGKTISYHKVAFTSLISYAFSQTIGFALLSGGAVRYRFYMLWGIKPTEIAKVILFSGLHFWSGLFLLAGTAALYYPSDFILALNVSRESTFILSLILLAPILAYLLLTLFKKILVRRFPVFRFLPSFPLAIFALTTASLDWLLASSILYQLLPGRHQISFFHSLSSFLIAQIAGVITHIPGGLGIFETIVLQTLSEPSNRTSILAALIVFRFVYYLIPFVLALLLYTAFEIRKKLSTIWRFEQIFLSTKNLVATIVPPCLSFSVFLAGIVLLFSGATPTLQYRLQWIADIVPLAILESSHFANSVTGIFLLIISSAIRRRLDSAYRITCVLLAIGIFTSLAKGFDYEEAIFLSIIFVAVFVSKQYFYRKGLLFSKLNLKHFFSIAVVIAISIWLGLFSYKHVSYAKELWWEFALNSDAPRFLRSSVTASSILLIVALRTFLLRPKKFEANLPSAEKINELIPVIKNSFNSEANLALVGDKFIFQAEKSSSFIMYRISGNTWVSMGDPIGKEEEAEELVWEFKELCDTYSGFCSFYEVSTRYFPIYLDIGLRLHKLGEQAIVMLHKFSIDGAQGKGFRAVLNRFEKENYQFEIHSPDILPEYLPKLKQISDNWLDSKKTKEKGFSIGYYNENYLSYFPFATVKRDNDILAFANIWTSDVKEELSLDLMRYSNNPPNGLMEYLLLNLILWGKNEGYHRFNLGMAPLSGFEPRKTAPVWNKLCTYLYTQGNTFYNFEGLRKFKEKFHPVWEPKYLASPGAIALPQVITNIASLISGSLKGVVSK